MGFNDFIAAEPRSLPIFVLADCSGSMAGEKILALNQALRDMVRTLQDMDDLRGSFRLCLICFGGDVRVLQPLTELDRLCLPELVAGGCTPMGQAFEQVRTLIEDRAVVSSRDYAPTVVLVSDGLPTDCPELYIQGKHYQDWEPLRALLSSPRAAKSQRLALGIGEDADMDMLSAFLNAPETPVMQAEDAGGIDRFFQWVTMSTVARLRQTNPNETAPLPFDPSQEELLI